MKCFISVRVRIRKQTHPLEESSSSVEAVDRKHSERTGDTLHDAKLGVLSHLEPSCLPFLSNSAGTLYNQNIRRKEVKGEDKWKWKGEIISHITKRVITHILIKLAQKGDRNIIAKDFIVFIFNFLWIKARILLMHSNTECDQTRGWGFFSCRNEFPDLKESNMVSVVPSFWYDTVKTWYAEQETGKGASIYPLALDYREKLPLYKRAAQHNECLHSLVHLHRV